MFIMKNKAGNLLKKVYSDRKREQLENLGYFVVSGHSDNQVTEIPVERDENNMTSRQKSLDDMTVKELKALAKEKGFDIKSDKKADIIAEIKNALAESEQIID